MRLFTIDSLRGLALGAMILIHTCAYFLSDKAAYLFWNLDQYAVQIFVFCSAYLFFLKTPPLTYHSAQSYLKKRFRRLLVPYFVFLLALFIAVIIVKPSQLTPTYIFQQVTMTTHSPDVNWLVLLFLSLSFVKFFISYTWEKKRILFWTFTGLSLLSSILFTFYNPHINFKFTMWLPWSLIVLFAFYFYHFERRRWFFPVTILGSLSIFCLAWALQLFRGSSLSFYDNKYPPNLFFLSYGMVFIAIFYVIFEKLLYKEGWHLGFLHFLSKNSYSLFFIQFVVIFVFQYKIPYLKLGWVGFFLIVLLTSMAVQKLILLKNVVLRPQLLK